jgi:hypothetical protein
MLNIKMGHSDNLVRCCIEQELLESNVDVFKNQGCCFNVKKLPKKIPKK